MLIIILLLLQDVGQPGALRAMEAARKGVLSFDCVWSTEMHKQMPRRPPPGKPVRFLGRQAQNGDLYFEALGDPDGVTSWDQQSQPTAGMRSKILANADGYWVYTPGSLDAKHNDVHPRAYNEIWGSFFQWVDARAIGVLPGINTPRDVAEVWMPLENAIGGMQWEEEFVRDEGVWRVTKRMDDGRTMTWRINPDKGWNPESVVLTYPAQPGRGERRVSVVNTVQQFGDVWFPALVEHYVHDELVATTVVETARFNQPDAPKTFPTSVLGLGVGATVRCDKGKLQGAGGFLRWAGDKTVTDDELFRLSKAGTIRLDQRLIDARTTGFLDSPELLPEQRERMRKVAADMRVTSYLTGHLSYWEQYVRDFIHRHELNEEQSEKCLQILRDCQKKGNEYAERHKDRFNEVEEKIRAASVAADASALNRARNEAVELRAPLDRIFEEQLKPRLETIPTRAQKAAAEEKARAATQPARRDAKP